MDLYISGMAWLYKHPRSQYWQIGWRVGNKLFNRSTKAATRADAEKQLALLDLMADAKRGGRLTEDFFNSLNGRELERITLWKAVEKYLEMCKGTTTAGTYVRYRMVLNSLMKFLNASDTAPRLGDIDSEIIQGFLNDARTRTSASNVNFYRKCLNAFFADARDKKKITGNPVSSVGAYKATKEDMEVSRRPFQESEIRAAYAAAPNDFWRFAIVFGLYTGLRLGNVATLRWREVDLNKRTIHVVDIKSPAKLEIPIESPFLINLFVELRKKSPKATPENFLFPEYARLYLAKSKDGENRAAKLSGEFRDILVAAKLLEKYRNNKPGTERSYRRTVSPLSFHSLRHNFVTILKERGASQMVARELVGHDSDAVNQLYTHTSPEIIRESIKRLPEVFK